jgi:hypothetical protein
LHCSDPTPRCPTPSEMALGALADGGSLEDPCRTPVRHKLIVETLTLITWLHVATFPA